ncbi:tRNA (adenine(58)-N(1))-methyltransferase catalytic subunit TRMT61A [Camellia lanceoleosa]|uniref:tRNA (Adenine(58)-N(1))-methyltransferase catalytic subunit TRMT61A n=1 Tax=Camellia lanceoleosa TaxID=1840588 RepID=A0ACC0IXC6_9ERIC|nr:tRNA (adenine(58)-N(1))-methyltransferase catalytic subunit TRMT61A [Camellia lanceoleosa]
MSGNLISYLTSYDLEFGKEPFLAALDIAYKILVMLLIDPAKKISFNHNISDGDLVIVYEKHDNMKAVKVSPTPELWTLVLCHRTQILYVANISFVIMYLELVFGCLVLESGTESGSLTTSLARAVALTGHVYTFDFHKQRAASAREGKIESFQADDSAALGSLPCNRKHGSNEGSNACSLTLMVGPSVEARGHTGYLTFAGLGCLS